MPAKRKSTAAASPATRKSVRAAATPSEEPKEIVERTSSRSSSRSSTKASPSPSPKQKVKDSELMSPPTGRRSRATEKTPPVEVAEKTPRATRGVKKTEEKASAKKATPKSTPKAKATPKKGRGRKSKAETETEETPETESSEQETESENVELAGGDKKSEDISEASEEQEPAKSPEKSAAAESKSDEGKSPQKRGRGRGKKTSDSETSLSPKGRGRGRNSSSATPSPAKKPAQESPILKEHAYVLGDSGEEVEEGEGKKDGDTGGVSPEKKEATGRGTRGRTTKKEPAPPTVSRPRRSKSTKAADEKVDESAKDEKMDEGKEKVDEMKNVDVIDAASQKEGEDEKIDAEKSMEKSQESTEKSADKSQESTEKSPEKIEAAKPDEKVQNEEGKSAETEKSDEKSMEEDAPVEKAATENIALFEKSAKRSPYKAGGRIPGFGDDDEEMECEVEKDDEKKDEKKDEELNKCVDSETKVGESPEDKDKDCPNEKINDEKQGDATTTATAAIKEDVTPTETQKKDEQVDVKELIKPSPVKTNTPIKSWSPKRPSVQIIDDKIVISDIIDGDETEEIPDKPQADVGSKSKDDVIDVDAHVAPVISVSPDPVIMLEDSSNSSDGVQIMDDIGKKGTDSSCKADAMDTDEDVVTIEPTNKNTPGDDVIMTGDCNAKLSTSCSQGEATKECSKEELLTRSGEGGTKRKMDDCEEGCEESDDTSKKARLEQNCNDNHTNELPQEVLDTYVVVQKTDVPKHDDLPNIPVPPSNTTTNHTSYPTNALFTRKNINNPAVDFTRFDAKNRFSVVSYNVLADQHLKLPENASADEIQAYNRSYRHDRLMEEIRYLDSDVVCLQEVTKAYHDDYLKASMLGLGYSGQYQKHLSDRPWDTRTYNQERTRTTDCFKATQVKVN